VCRSCVASDDTVAAQTSNSKWTTNRCFILRDLVAGKEIWQKAVFFFFCSDQD